MFLLQKFLKSWIFFNFPAKISKNIQKFNPYLVSNRLAIELRYKHSIRKEINFSATFHDKDNLDYKYPMDKAIENLKTSGQI